MTPATLPPPLVPLEPVSLNDHHGLHAAIYALNALLLRRAHVPIPPRDALVTISALISRARPPRLAQLLADWHSHPTAPPLVASLLRTLPEQVAADDCARYDAPGGVVNHVEWSALATAYNVCVAVKFIVGRGGERVRVRPGWTIAVPTPRVFAADGKHFGSGGDGRGSCVFVVAHASKVGMTYVALLPRGQDVFAPGRALGGGRHARTQRKNSVKSVSFHPELEVDAQRAESKFPAASAIAQRKREGVVETERPRLPQLSEVAEASVQSNGSGMVGQSSSPDLFGDDRAESGSNASTVAQTTVGDKVAAGVEAQGDEVGTPMARKLDRRNDVAEAAVISAAAERAGNGAMETFEYETATAEMPRAGNVHVASDEISATHASEFDQSTAAKESISGDESVAPKQHIAANQPVASVIPFGAADKLGAIVETTAVGNDSPALITSVKQDVSDNGTSSMESSDASSTMLLEAREDARRSIEPIPAVQTQAETVPESAASKKDILIGATSKTTESETRPVGGSLHNEITSNATGGASDPTTDLPIDELPASLQVVDTLVDNGNVIPGTIAVEDGPISKDETSVSSHAQSDEGVQSHEDALAVPGESDLLAGDDIVPRTSPGQAFQAYSEGNPNTVVSPTSVGAAPNDAETDSSIIEETIDSYNKVQTRHEAPSEEFLDLEAKRVVYMRAQNAATPHDAVEFTFTPKVASVTTSIKGVSEDTSTLSPFGNRIIETMNESARAEDSDCRVEPSLGLETHEVVLEAELSKPLDAEEESILSGASPVEGNTPEVVAEGLSPAPSTPLETLSSPRLPPTSPLLAPSRSTRSELEIRELYMATMLFERVYGGTRESSKLGQYGKRVAREPQSLAEALARVYNQVR